MSQPIRVLAFMEAYVVNGAAKSLLNFCDSLHSSGDNRVRLAVATFVRGDVHRSGTPNEFVAAARSRGLDVFIIPERRAFDPGVLALIRNLVRSFQPDVIETNNVKSHFLVKLSGANRNRGWVAVHHGYTLTDSKMRLLNRLDRFSLPAADRVLLVCEAFRDQLAANKVTLNRWTVIHNAATLITQLPHPDIVRERNKIPNETKILVAIGRLSNEKGHADLLEALKRVDSNYILILVGSGPEETNLRSLARNSGLADRVIFAGQQADVLPYLSAANAMVLPSHSEGSPHVVLEAMAAGTPIIATKVGGVPEILTGDIAQLTPARNPEALAAAILDVLNNPQAAQARADRAKQVLRDNFSHDVYREKKVALYESILRRV